MTVKDIAVSAAALLQADDLAEILDDPAAAASDTEVKTLVKCVNTAVAGAANDGFPVVLCELVRAEGGVIPLSAFSRDISIVRRIRHNGETVTFSYCSGGIAVPYDGEYSVEYTAEPEEAALGDTPELGAMCDMTMLSYLTARNYCLVTGRTDEAQIWDQLYEDVSAKKRLTRRAKLPCRGGR